MSSQPTISAPVVGHFPNEVAFLILAAYFQETPNLSILYALWPRPTLYREAKRILSKQTEKEFFVDCRELENLQTCKKKLDRYVLEDIQTVRVKLDTGFEQHLPSLSSKFYHFTHLTTLKLCIPSAGSPATRILSTGFYTLFFQLRDLTLHVPNANPHLSDSGKYRVFIGHLWIFNLQGEGTWRQADSKHTPQSPNPQEKEMCSCGEGEGEGLTFCWCLWEPIPGVLYKSFWEDAFRAAEHICVGLAREESFPVKRGDEGKVVEEEGDWEWSGDELSSDDQEEDVLA